MSNSDFDVNVLAIDITLTSVLVDQTQAWLSPRGRVL